MHFRRISIQFEVFFCDLVILLLWSEKAQSRGLSAQDQTRSSPCICVSFIKQVNPPRHLLSKSLNKNTTEEKSVKPVALTYLTVVCELNSESLRSQCLSFSFPLSPLSHFSILYPAALCKWQHLQKATEKWRLNKTITSKDKVAFHFEYKSIPRG